MITLTDIQRGYESWAAKPHNAKWVRRIDGTPIPNDIPVCIFDFLRDSGLLSHPPRSLSNEGSEMLHLAVAAVLEADTEFRAQMMPGWEGDPLSDEIEGLRRIFAALSTRKGSAGDGSATFTSDNEGNQP